jgi:hypothetical protein
MSYARHTGDVATALLDRLHASGAPVASVAVHGREVELELDPVATPAQGMSVLRGLAGEDAVSVQRSRGHADLRAKIGRWRVRLRVHRESPAAL